MNLLINFFYVYLAIAIAKFILMLPATYQQARFVWQTCEDKPNFALLNIQMVLSYVLVAFCWPYFIISERGQFFCFQPFNREVKAAIASALEFDLNK